MDQLLPEIISYIFRFMGVSDRKEAALVCKKWYYASLDPYLQRDIIFKCRLHDQRFAMPKLYGRKLTHISLGDEDSSMVSEEYLTDLLFNSPHLYHLDLSFCNSLFLSGQLFSNEQERSKLRSSLSTVKELKLTCLRHMTDVTFTRLVSILENVQSISLASNNIIFNNNSGSNSMSAMSSPAVFNFSSFLRFVKERAAKLKQVDLSFTSINDQALEDFSSTPSLHLDELILKGCVELTDKGIASLTKYQNQLQILDISSCKTLGTGKTFFRKLANMATLHTLKARKCPHIGQCDIQSLADLPSLHTIDIGETLNLFQNDLIKGLCSSTHNLSVVQLAYCSEASDQFVVALCQSNPQLKHLDLTSCWKITDTSLHNITRNLLSLQFLCLAYCRDISDLGLIGYVAAKGEEPHRHLFEHDHETCTCTRQKESRIFIPPKGILKQHQTSITKAQTQLESGEILYKLSNLTSLKSLDLSGCSKVTDLGIIEAVKFQELKNVSLEYLPKLTDAGVAHLVRNNPSLETVSLRSDSELTDTAVNSLCTHLPRLRSLNLSQIDKLTTLSVERLSQSCKRLRQLDISFCQSISCDVVMALDKTRPDMKFKFRPHYYLI